MEQFKIKSAINNRNVISYYVSNTGSDNGNNDGLTPETPFATVSHAISVAITNSLKYDIEIILISDIIESSSIVMNNIGRKIVIKSESSSNKRKITVANNISDYNFNSSTHTLTFTTPYLPLFGIMVNNNIIPLTVDDKDGLRKPYGMKLYNINSWNPSTQIMTFTTSSSMPSNLTTDSFFQFIYEFKCCISRFVSVNNGVYTIADPISEPRAYGGSRFRIFNCSDYLTDNTYYYVSNENDTYTITCKLDSSVTSIEDVYIFNSRNIFEIKNSFGITIKDIEVYGNIGHGFGYLTMQSGLPFVDWSPKDYYNGILIQDCSNITITDCFFTKTQDYAIRVDNASNIYINKNRFYDMYGGGVDVTYESYNVYVDNNVINGYGRFNTEFSGILLRRVHHCTALHNDICDGFYTAISVGWSFNYDNHTNNNLRVAYNYIHHIGQFVMADGGGIHCFGNLNDSYVEYNKIHDVFTWYQNSNQNMAMCGIYCDSGTAYLIVRYNLSYCTDYFNHSSSNYNVDFFNNIFAYPRKNVAIKINNGYNYEKTVLWEHNIFLTTKPLLFENKTNTASYHRNFITGIPSAEFEDVIDDNNVFGNNPFTDSANADFSFAISEDNGFTFGNDERYGSLDFDILQLELLDFLNGGYGCIIQGMEQYKVLPNINNMSYNAYYKNIANSQNIEYAFL